MTVIVRNFVNRVIVNILAQLSTVTVKGTETKGPLHGPTFQNTVTIGLLPTTIQVNFRYGRDSIERNTTTIR